MNFHDLIESLRLDTTAVSLPAFKPELALTATIVLMLLARLPRWGWKLNSFWIALPGSMIALVLAAPWLNLGDNPDPLLLRAAGFQTFTGLLVFDGLTVYFRAVLLLFLVLFLILTRISGIPDREDSADIYTLAFGATLGMCIMASANHLLMVFLGVEMASVPSYAMAGMLKGRRQSSEAALKFAVYGAGAAGVMLYGISLLAGSLGTAHLPTIAMQLASLSGDALADRQFVLILGGLMVAVGLAFKLSAVPFHFWAPDVFEGAAAEVGGFLSVASKAAALALLLRVGLGFSYVPEIDASVAVADSGRTAVKVHLVSDGPAGDERAATAGANESAADAGPSATGDVESTTGLEGARRFIAALIGLFAAMTCTFGNLAAYAQTNIKRLLAYSTIAHAGYMMMPAAAAVLLMGHDRTAAQGAIAAVAFYAAVYLFMNLGAFAIVAFLRNSMRSEELADYAGLIQRAPAVAVCLALIMVSLLGIPPLSGFMAKLVAFSALVTAGKYASWFYVLLFIGGLNTVISLFYYLRVVKLMTMDPEPEHALPGAFSIVSAPGVYMALITLPVVALGVWWNPLNEWALSAASRMFS